MGVAAKNSLSQSIDKAVKRYSSLFRLPSHKNVVLLLILICIVGVFLSTVVLFPTVEGAVYGLLLGGSLFSVNYLFEYVVRTLVLKRDVIYDSRRTAALSLFCWAFWLFFIFMGAVVAKLFGLSWWVRLCLLGFSTVLIFRLTVFGSKSPAGRGRLFIASILQPFSCICPFLMLWSRVGYPITVNMALFFVFSPVVALASSFSFLFLLNRVGQKTLGIPSLSLLKAFLLTWILDVNGPLEEFLEKLGEEQDVEVSLLKFGSAKPKAVMVVPSVHPGPFKNIGSSTLPSLIKTAVEKKLGCVACVPHGLFSHELDLASQSQNQKLIKHLLELKGFKTAEAEATAFVTATQGVATACCQIFGKFAFISFTLAPNTTEDLPQDLGLFVRQEAEKHGLTCSIVVNAHNSILENASMSEALEDLRSVATSCLEEALALKRLPLRVGASTIRPEEFTLSEGMGPGGITAVIVEVGEQKTAYVVIDGNNMVSGLREEILSVLRSSGFSTGEVFTTDTHAVSAITLSKRGYSPVGEAIDHEKLISYIKKATSDALSDLGSVDSVSCCNMTIPKVKVIGEKRLETLCLLIDKALQKAKQIVVPIFATSGLVLMLFLLFI